MSGNPSLPSRDAGYTSLLERMREILAEGRERARLAVESERVRTYWEGGDVLRAHLQERDPQYGEQVLKKLSVDVGLAERLLYEMLELRDRFPKLAPGPKLTWSHYRRLIRVADGPARRYYQKAATEQGWSVRELESFIRADAFATNASAGQNAQDADVLQAAATGGFAAKRGELYVYRVAIKEGRPALDLGFRTFRRLQGGVGDGFQPGDLVRSVADGRAPGGYRLEPAELRRRLFSYRATVAKVIDGDTLWATVDLGFGFLTDEKLRLRAIDTPELNTDAGKRARDHLVKTLQAAGEFVVTTTKIDLYDRYLMDVFVLPGEKDLQRVAREGRFVNRELVEEGFARRWTAEKPPEF